MNGQANKKLYTNTEAPPMEKIALPPELISSSRPDKTWIDDGIRPANTPAPTTIYDIAAETCTQINNE